MSTPAFDGVVLAGGASRRFGTDKALVEVDGLPMAHRVVAALRAAGAARVQVVGGSAGAAPPGAVHVEDEHPGDGPLGALAHALSLPGEDIVVVLACDFPAAASSEILHLVQVLGAAGPGPVVAVSMLGGREQWLHGAWRRSAAPELRQRFDAGVRAVRDAVADLEVLEVAPIADEALLDVDRPEDLGRYAATHTDETRGG